MDRDNRAHRGKAKIKSRLIADLDPDEWEFPPKPKWMRWSTYLRYEEKFDRYESILDEGCAELMAKLFLRQCLPACRLARGISLFRYQYGQRKLNAIVGLSVVAGWWLAVWWTEWDVLSFCLISQMVFIPVALVGLALGLISSLSNAMMFFYPHGIE